jgi:hypothetical protein
MKKIVITLAFFCVLALSQARSLPGLPEIPGIPLPTGTLPQIPIPANIPPLPNVSAGATVPSNTQKPDYGFTKNILSAIDFRTEQITNAKLSIAEMINLDNWKTYTQNFEHCKKIEAQKQLDLAKCPQYEYTVPFSLEEDSRKVAQALRRAWMRLEDRGYWRVMTQLNNPGMWFSHCLISWSDGPNPSLPEVRFSISKDDVAAALGGNVTYPEPEVPLRLDSYLPIPTVPASDYCDDFTMEILPLMYIPGFCIAVYGFTLFCTGDYPQPIWFNDQEATSRVTEAITHMQTKYLADYQVEVIKELAPLKDGRVFMPMPWSNPIPGGGAVIAPIINMNLDPSVYVTHGQNAQNDLGGLEGANALPYYLQRIARLPNLDLHLVPGSNDVAYIPPGVWRLEEYKRWMKTSNQLYHEQIGYVSMMQAWQTFDTTILPEGNLIERAARTIQYFGVGLKLDFYINAMNTYVDPFTKPIAPFNVPFVGPRMRWTWVSVPEGYQIPRVQGNPLFDYSSLLR